jgi:predicted short-subunit dehydrogenase-like oxidoreductase (DUF2520 family)
VDTAVPDPAPPEMLAPVALVGAGALGSTLAQRLAVRGVAVSAVVSRTGTSAARVAQAWPDARHGPDLALVRDAPVVVLCVPDAALAEVAARLADTAGPWTWRLVLHTSGVLPAAVLAPLGEAGAAVLSFHPAQAFAPGTPERAFEGVPVVLEGAPAAVAAGRRLARTLGLHAVELPAGGKAAYHLALALVSNYTVTLTALATEVLATLGVALPDALALVRPLLDGTVQNLHRSLPERALTGPIARGDVDTVGRHLAVLQEALPHLVPVYAALATETVRVAVRGGRIAPDAADALLARLEDALGGEEDEGR